VHSSWTTDGYLAAPSGLATRFAEDPDQVTVEGYLAKDGSKALSVLIGARIETMENPPGDAKYIKFDRSR